MNRQSQNTGRAPPTHHSLRCDNNFAVVIIFIIRCLAHHADISILSAASKVKLCLDCFPADRKKSSSSATDDTTFVCNYLSASPAELSSKAKTVPAVVVLRSLVPSKSIVSFGGARAAVQPCHKVCEGQTLAQPSQLY